MIQLNEGIVSLILTKEVDNIELALQLIESEGLMPQFKEDCEYEKLKGWTKKTKILSGKNWASFQLYKDEQDVSRAKQSEEKSRQICEDLIQALKNMFIKIY